MDARLAALCLWFVCASAVAFDHSAWDQQLRRHVVVLDGGNVSQLRYAAMDRGTLKRYLESLSAVPAAQFERWAQAERKAFLINAYNAFTVEKILTRYPDIRSIWDFGKVFGNPFKDEFFTLLGRRASLDWIEHDTLRKLYPDPRLHFALNCASVGCPMLREEAYVAARLEAQLDEQARRFLSDRSRNRYREGRLEVSRIFDWYKEDFAPRERWFARHAGLLGADAEAAGRAKLVFLEYDWALNDFRSSSPR
jgi:hypothetical protein